MAAKKQKETSTELDVLEVTQSVIQFHLVGTSPLICNRMSEKIWRELLLPNPKKSRSQKEATLKHNPLEEFRASPYLVRDDSAPTLIVVPGAAFKGAMGTAALDMEGVNKTQIGRLVRVVEYNVPVYGTPEMLMSCVRNSDMKRTPDVRTRAILPRWACTINVRFTTPILRERPVANLMAAAGIIAGVGDWRPEKGKGDFGTWRLASADDPEFLDIVQNHGRAVQVEAMNNPACFDDETEELLDWFRDEADRRGFKVVA